MPPRVICRASCSRICSSPAPVCGGATGAAAAFSARHGATIRGAIARIVRGADAGEVEQQLSPALLVGSAACASPRSGATPARRRSIGGSASRRSGRRSCGLRENRAEARARDVAAAEPAAERQHSPGDDVSEDRYRGDFEQALKDALGRLPERERMLLRLHLVNGVSVDKIGQMFAVSQPTASRWLAAARETLLDDIKATLGNPLGASSQELASMAGLVASRLDSQPVDASPLALTVSRTLTASGQRSSERNSERGQIEMRRV